MRYFFMLPLVSCFVSSVNSQQTDAQAYYQNTALQKVKVFATELKSALASAIQKDGLLAAVEVCEKRAPEIAAELSTDGWTVARTSLKARNEGNQPDEWEKQVLMGFDERYMFEEKAKALSISVIDKDQFRFMKAIPTEQVCLACHGSSVDPSLLKAINAIYPKDAAIGFTLEDIRGAFTVTKDINNAP